MSFCSALVFGSTQLQQGIGSGSQHRLFCFDCWDFLLVWLKGDFFLWQKKLSWSGLSVRSTSVPRSYSLHIHICPNICSDMHINWPYWLLQNMLWMYNSLYFCNALTGQSKLESAETTCIPDDREGGWSSSQRNLESGGGLKWLQRSLNIFKDQFRRKRKSQKVSDERHLRGF